MTKSSALTTFVLADRARTMITATPGSIAMAIVAVKHPSFDLKNQPARLRNGLLRHETLL